MNKGKVVLYYPTYGEIAENQYHWFPFSYLYLAPFLEKAGFSVEIIDARVESQWYEKLETALRGAICIGVTSMTGPDINSVLKAAALAKSIDASMPVVWGGVHASVLPELTVKHDLVDIVVCGMSNYAFPELCHCIAAGIDYKDIPGLYYKVNGIIHHNPVHDSLSCYDSDFFPCFHLLDIERYRSPNNVVSTFTAIGCPFNCTFCTQGEKKGHINYIARKVEQVEQEIHFQLEDLGFSSVFIQDGTFFYKKKRVLEIAQWLIDSGFKISWQAKARANSLLEYTSDELKLLKKSGLVSIQFGIESGSRRILKQMSKGITPSMAQRSAQICHEYDIVFFGSYMFAVPQETVDDLTETIELIRSIERIHPKAIFQNSIYIPLPGTPMFEQTLLSGYKPPDTLEGWANRNIFTNQIENRTDITWIPPNIMSEYVRIYNTEFGTYKHAWEKERDGDIKSFYKTNTP